MTTRPELSQEEWQAAAEAGDDAVRIALGELAKMLDKDTRLLQAVCFGAVTAVGELFSIVTNQDKTSQLGIELWAVAHLRGAIRRLDYPVHEDGRQFDRAFDG